MEYEIKKKDSIYFLPTVEEWIFESFDLNLLEGVLYKLILQQKAFVWTSEYIGRVLRVSGKTVYRAVDSLVKKEVIKKYYTSKGSKTRWVLVALYNSNGRIPTPEVIQSKNEGEKRIEMEERKHHLKKKRNKLVQEINNLDELIGF
nr:MAG TPA: Sugar-specific transcriptional regulator TrmB [Caudoviricetes sp.]